MTKKKVQSSKNSETEAKKGLKSDKKHVKSAHKKHDDVKEKPEIKPIDDQVLQEKVEIVSESDKNADQDTKKTTIEADSTSKPKFELSGKQLNIAIAVVAILVVLSGALGFYLLQQNTEIKNNSSLSENKPEQPKQDKITDQDIKSIQALAITPDMPDLDKFSVVLNQGSALPLDFLEADKREGFIGGTEVTLASEVDSIGKRMALVQSVSTL